MNELNFLKKQLLYKSSRRGTKEMDFYLGSFFKNHCNLMKRDDFCLYSEFLDFDDDIIENWLYNGGCVPNKFEELIKKIKMEFGFKE